MTDIKRDTLKIISVDFKRHDGGSIRVNRKKGQMTETELAYIAGIVDGEGNIGLHKVNGYYRIDVAVTNTNEWLPHWLQLQFGGCVMVARQRLNNRKDIWRWKISGNKAVDCLKLLIPYLMLKGAQAEIAIAVQDMRQQRHHHLTEKEMAVAEAQYIVMRGLNAKGITRRSTDASCSKAVNKKREEKICQIT